MVRALLASFAALLWPVLAAAAEERPNIVVILADDLGPEALACYGGESYSTPNIDALARSGTRFERCYATPLCSPSRVQLLTGRYGIHTGWKVNIDEDDLTQHLDTRSLTTAGQALQAAGYATAWAGKWQLARFDVVPDHLPSAGFAAYRAWAWFFEGRRTSRYWDPVVFEDGRAHVAKGRYGDDLFSDFVLEFARRQKDRPFFVVYSTALTHDPWVPTPDSRATASREDRSAKTFADNVAYLDKIVGKVVTGLDTLGLRNRTLVLFTSDNGTDRHIVSTAASTRIKGGKGSVSEAGSRVPLIASWPGRIPAGRTTEALVDFTDFLPTFLDIAKAPAHPQTDGRSFLPLLLGRSETGRPWIFVDLGDQYFLRDGTHRLNSQGQLFTSRGVWNEEPCKLSDGGCREARDRLAGYLKELDDRQPGSLAPLGQPKTRAPKPKKKRP